MIRTPSLFVYNSLSMFNFILAFEFEFYSLGSFVNEGVGTMTTSKFAFCFSVVV